MSLILGIDTGGTYTDGDLFEVSSNTIIQKAKLLTTYDDLTKCIKACMCSLGVDATRGIGGVSLSTTLATNAIVEGRGCEVGLVIIGKEPEGKLPVKYCQKIKGGHNVKGVALENINPQEVVDAVDAFRGKVSAVAISGYFSVRNPEHELYVLKQVQEALDIPVVCAHQLSRSLGYYERTVTTVLNAQLVPIIVDLIQSINTVLAELHVNAPLMIVKGDGSLMDENVAKERPIETILSGPASSIIGSTSLTGCTDALVLDMGGTTTDIAVVQGGVPRVNPEGASVDGWLTRVQAVDINTYGIGGDSYIQADNSKRLIIGPQKVVPLCVAAHRYPYLTDELAELRDTQSSVSKSNPADCLMLVSASGSDTFTEKEQALVRLLEPGPHVISYVEKCMREQYRFFNIDSLLDKGVVRKISLTPTDILHASGTYERWNCDAARIGAHLLADKLGMTIDDFHAYSMESICEKISRLIFQTLLDSDQSDVQLKKSSDAQYFVKKMLHPSNNSSFGITPKVHFPIVAVGAPVKAYIPSVAKKVHAEIIIPENHEVANAVGAATGKWIERISILIKTDSVEGVVLYAPWERVKFQDVETAKVYALRIANEKIEAEAKNAGVQDYEVTVDERDFFVDSAEGIQGIHVETEFGVTATGRPGLNDQPMHFGNVAFG